MRQELSAPLVADLEALAARASGPSCRAATISPRRWTTCSSAGRPSPASSMTGGSASSNNAAERALRGIALGRKSWLFAGSDRGGQRAAAMYSLIVTAKMNDIDPQAWLADVLARIAEHPAHEDRRVAAVELAAELGTAQPGRLIMAAISAVFTIGYVANLLGEDEDWLLRPVDRHVPGRRLPLGLRCRRGRRARLHQRRHREPAPDHRRRTSRRPRTAELKSAE